MEIKRYKMKYKIDNNVLNVNRIKIIDKEFIKNNKNKAKLIIENKKYSFSEYFYLNDFKKSELKIDILFNRDISNLSYMFNDCSSLLNFSINNNLEIKEIINEYLGIWFDNNNNYNKSEDDIKEVDEDKGNIFCCIKNGINYEYSEIIKK